MRSGRGDPDLFLPPAKCTGIERTAIPTRLTSVDVRAECCTSLRRLGIKRVPDVLMRPLLQPANLVTTGGRRKTDFFKVAYLVSAALGIFGEMFGSNSFK